jgi:hypothetical protein
VLADSPFIYYRLGDPPGSTTVADSSGNGHNGAAIGGVTFGQPGALAGDPDTSASFDGSTGIVDSGTQPLSPSSTIEAWIHPTSSQCSGSGCSAGQSAIAGTGGSFQLTWGRVPSHVIVWLWSAGDNGFRTLEAPDAIPLDTWTYLATTWDGATDQLSIYINGALDATVSLPGVISSKQQGGRSYNFAVGGFTSGEQPFQGGIDEVAYYGSALTPARILAHYKAGVTPSACQATATHVEMFDSHTLEIDVTSQFSNDPNSAKSLSATTNINGVALSSNSQLLPGSTGAQSASLFIDLAANNVPRFTANARFSVTAAATEGGTTCTGAAQAATVLLPVVIIPGIINGNGGDGRFPALESYLGDISNILPNSNLLGEPYTLRSSGTGYPTLYTLSYPTNTASFLEGAVQLNGLINQIKGLTYADKVNVVTHSKGGLVAREYLEGISGPGPSSVNQLIMAEPPNLGALAASWIPLIPPNTHVDLRNLVPTWSWHRNNATQPFAATPPNPELDALNSMPMPSSVQYTLIYSTSNLTPWTETGHPGPGGLIFTDTPGDGIVPAFSMRGLELDPNNPSLPPVLIPAFQGITINEVSIPGSHIGYLQQQNVMAEIASLVSN